MVTKPIRQIQLKLSFKHVKHDLPLCNFDPPVPLYADSTLSVPRICCLPPPPPSPSSSHTDLLRHKENQLVPTLRPFSLFDFST